MWRLQAVLVGVLLVVPTLEAQKVKILEPAGDVITLSGTLGAPLIETQITVDASAPSSTLECFVTDLTRTDKGEKLRLRAEIGTPPAMQLTRNGPLRFPVQVKNPRNIGTFDGTLLVYLNGAKQIEKPLRVTIDPVEPTPLAFVTPATALSLKIVKTDSTLGGRLARVLLPDSSLIRRANVEVATTGAAALVNPTKSFALRGELNGEELKSPKVQLSVPALVTADGRSRFLHVPVTTDPSDIQPDKYRGFMWIAADNVPSVAVPFEIDVRADPLWPSAVVLLGVLLGRFVRWLEGDGSRLTAILKRLRDAESRIPAAQAALLQPMIDETRADANELRLDHAERELPRIEERAEILRELDALDNGLDPNDPQHTQILHDVETARRAIAVKNDTAARTLLDKVRQSLTGLTITPVATKVSTAAHRAATFASRAAAPRMRERVGRQLTRLSGVASLTPGEGVRYARVFSFYVLLLVIAYVGLRSNYVSNTTFGAERLPDYLGALLWGLGADIAGKTLSSISLRS